MKKGLIVLCLISLFTFLLSGCETNIMMKDMPKYDKEERYYDKDSFRDHTDYCKYFYNENSIKAFETDSRFKKVMSDDIENIKSYFKRVEEFVMEYMPYRDHYDFNLSKIKEGDYYIDSKEGRPIGTGVYEKYDNYNVYYVDMEKRTLYFIHHNI